MACQDIGEANPDIAGIGILAAFSIQGGISVMLSIYCLLVGLTLQSRVRAVNLHFVAWPFVKVSERITRQSSSLQRYHEIFEDAVRYLEDPIPTPIRTDKGIQKQKLAKDVLVASSDIQSWSGIALLVAAFVQIRTNSLYQLHIIYDTVSFVAISNCAAIATTYGPWGPRHLVMMIWSFLYIAYTIAFGIRLRSWRDDKAGQCYITSGISSSGASHPYVDNIYVSVTCVYVILSLYAALGLNAAAFSHANYGERILSALRRGIEHLEALNVNVELFNLDYAFASLVLSPQIPRGMPPVFVEDPNGKQITALLIAILQYPVHIYFVYTLRAANENHLTLGNTEQDWGFGQVVAVILLGSNLVMVVDGIWKYREWRRHLQERAP